MAYNTPYAAYAHARENLSTSEQIVLLYEACIGYISEAQNAIERQDHDTRYKMVEKVGTILHGLRACLDFERSPDAAEALDKYYDAMDRLLVSIQCHHKIEECQQVSECLMKIRDIWKKIAESENNDSTFYPCSIVKGNDNSAGSHCSLMI
ncbi:flagellar export chaperone FliS [Rickettsiales bacterium]|nr:flagellar export chaperone FliS [Rickettsiales bacterium]